MGSTLKTFASIDYSGKKLKANPRDIKSNPPGSLWWIFWQSPEITSVKTFIQSHAFNKKNIFYGKHMSTRKKYING